MKILSHCLLLLTVVASLCSPVLAQSGPKDFSKSASAVVQEFVNQYGGTVGVSTQVLKSGKVPFSYNGTKPLIPASNLKLVTTAVALDKLGRDFRFETRLYGPATVTGGTLDGDLVLKGGGDPTFYPPFVDSPTTPFENLIEGLRRNGVKRIEGNLIVDDSDFDRRFISQSYHDRYLLDGYAAPVGGLGLNRNMVTLSISPSESSVEPDTGSLALKRDVKEGGSDQIWAERSRGTDNITVHGYVRPGSKALTTLTVGDPVRLAGSVFYRLIKKSGIQMNGKWTTVKEGVPAKLAGKVMLARHRSPVLMELIQETNKESDNLLAQHIFRRLGATLAGFGSVKNSEAVIREFFQEHNISDKGLKMMDGSGLSEQNRIAPYQVVGLLKAMWDHDDGQLFIDSLPAPGQGTLRSRLGGVVLRAKTGTLNNHSGLSGYVVTAYGETVAFSILVNDVNRTWPAVELQDDLVSMLSRWEQKL